PFTDVVTSELTLSNPSDKIICFKIQTTTQSRYCVRPKSGIMIPNQNVTVSVMLQPFHFDPNEKYNHKFMVQSIVIPKADIDLEAVWKASDIAAIMDTKLNCVFEWPANLAPAPASQDQLLAIKPPTELRFRGPFTDVVTSELTLSNPSDKIISFNIKTTTPRRYCVRPNSGIMIPNQNVTVSVMLQPFDFDPNEKYNHKFMVQSIVIPKADIDLEAVWKASDIAAIMDTKLKCVFEWPSNQTPAPASQDQLLAIKPPTELRFRGKQKSTALTTPTDTRTSTTATRRTLKAAASLHYELAGQNDLK
ncbi:vesicle-associated membrane protein-associated protein A-like, partial [Strongylocentrotus purpuratus]